MGLILQEIVLKDSLKIHSKFLERNCLGYFL